MGKHCMLGCRSGWVCEQLAVKKGAGFENYGIVQNISVIECAPAIKCCYKILYCYERVLDMNTMIASFPDLHRSLFFGLR